jgi:long-chain fatty acid transport protein
MLNPSMLSTRYIFNDNRKTKEETLMKKLFKVLVIFSCTVMLSTAAIATNGTNLIGIGPIARSMGGVGIAQPLDAISAVFSNSAAMCFGEYCPGSEFNFAGTAFMPKIDAKVTNKGTLTPGTFSADAEDNVYPIPAIGFSSPLGSDDSKWRFGLAAYGVSGLGVDYRNTTIDQSAFYPAPPLPAAAPLVTGAYTQLQIMKFAPAIAYQVTPSLSLGLGLPIDYGVLDLRNGGSSGFALGFLPGIIYKPIENLSLGLTYASPQKINYKNVTDFDQDGSFDSLELESPQQVGFGIAYDFFDAGLVIEADVKWINWANAKGYEDFDWDNQTVFAIGAQYKATDKIALRAGYNYAKNPVNEHNGFNGQTTATVQGKTLPSAYYYETFRIIGFPAIVEQHITLGVGYKFSDAFSLDLGFVYAIENSITETGTDLFGQPVELESTLSETSVDFGLTWRF